MSGRKSIQVDASEWYSLQRRAQQLRQVRRDIPRLLADVEEQTRASIDRAFSSVDARQRRQQEAMDELSDRTRHLEADTTRRLREQAGQLREELEKTAGRIEQDTRRRLEQQRRDTERAIAVERAERLAETARNQQDRARAEDTVRAWLSDARTMADLIAGQLPHDRYAPGRLDRLRRRITTADETARDGRFDAALAVAQETFHELSDLRVDIEQRELERCLAQQEAVEALVRVETLAKENQERPVVGPEGEAVAGYVLDVTHWAGGEYDRLRRDTADALARARDPRTGVDDLHALRDEEAPRLERSLDEAVERAGMRQLTSQLRVNLADVVAETLSEIAYYDLVEDKSGYSDGDMRRDFQALLRHEASGNEITVEITQPDQDSDQCVIRIVSHDHDNTAEAELRERADSVYRALREEGVPIGLDAAAPKPDSDPDSDPDSNPDSDPGSDPGSGLRRGPKPTPAPPTGSAAERSHGREDWAGPGA
jgi:hypothetical protein